MKFGELRDGEIKLIKSHAKIDVKTGTLQDGAYIFAPYVCL